MKSFFEVVKPHKDILEGRLTVDVFAADLFAVYKGLAPEEYQDPNIFFRKTYITAGMENLLKMVKKRLDGEGSIDAVIQLQTPFGGGKTHTLIALYHKAKEWKANVVVIDGTALDVRESTLWGEIERQLTGKIEILSGRIAPGKEKLSEVLKNFQPLLILMDEVLEYTSRAEGIAVGSSDLATQTIAFMQELTTVLPTLPRAALIVTLPSSLPEHYTEKGERLFQALQKVVGRVEKIFAPIQDEEVAQIVVRRLFDYIDEKSANEIIEKFVDYVVRKNILPEGQKALYREKFRKSYPFQPEVIDVLYKRWGSFPHFQRTRGVLRLLASVVYSLKDEKIPFIRLSDFDLRNEDIRRELIKHIGQEYDSILAADITSPDSGAKKVDEQLAYSYRPYKLGTRVATTIFMYSFSGGPEKGASLNEIKLSCAEPEAEDVDNIIAEVIERLRNHLFYLSDQGYFFTNQPNLNRLLLTKMENIEDSRIEEEEENLLKVEFSKSAPFKVYIWPMRTIDVPDTTELKLVVLKDKSRIKEFTESCGAKPRVNRNTLIFLCPSELEKGLFNTIVRKKLAWQEIKRDKTLNLTHEQEEKVKEGIKMAEESAKESIRNLYRQIYLPEKEEAIDLGKATFGVRLAEEVYQRLKSEGKLHESLSPMLISHKYLGEKDYAHTKNILESFYRTPGEIRLINQEAFQRAIKEGVEKGFFGLGILEENKPVCKVFKQPCTLSLTDDEIIIRKELCTILEKEKQAVQPVISKEEFAFKPLIQEEKEYKEREEKTTIEDKVKESITELKLTNLKLVVDISQGSFHVLAKVVNELALKFSEVNVKVEIHAKGGEISKFEYENKILEALSQAGKVDEEMCY